MFESLTERLNDIFTQLRRRGKLTPADVDAALREVRLALLEADVHYSVVKDLIARIRERAVGAEVAKALNPGQQVVKLVNEELVGTLGDAVPLNLSGEKPHVILLIGLQGSGKTTAAGKLAKLFRSRGERVLLVANDPSRPAAMEQLQILGGQLDIPVHFGTIRDPIALAKEALEKAKKGGFTCLIMDTAGRSQIEGPLMDELKEIGNAVHPVETLLVVDAMTGQEALHIARNFQNAIPITGIILSKMDGDSRGGAAISIRSVTGIPIKFIGTGEKLDALDVFHPDRMASRILGMGDILGLIEKAETAFEKSRDLEKEKNPAKGNFTLEDLADMLRSSKKMGSMNQMMDMLPGDIGRAARNVPAEDMEKSLKQTEAIISSMTRKERNNPDLLNASRRRRIAAGSGTQVQDVNKLIKQYKEMQKLMKTFQKSGTRNLSRLFG